MLISEAQLIAILPACKPVASAYIAPINAVMQKYNINTKSRVAAFIAQIGHESGQLLRQSENLNYTTPERVAAMFRSGFDLDSDRNIDPEEVEFAKAYLRNPVKLANRVYANRSGNGGESTGDGYTFRGRGPIGLTFRENYRACGKAIGLDLEQYPELVETPIIGMLTAGWYWDTRGLNALADAGRFDDIGKRINGGDNGKLERQKLHAVAKKVLSI